VGCTKENQRNPIVQEGHQRISCMEGRGLTNLELGGNDARAIRSYGLTITLKILMRSDLRLNGYNETDRRSSLSSIVGDCWSPTWHLHCE
jgi:hypothetical protein